MIFLMNTPVLTDWGTYNFRKISLSEVRDMLAGAITNAPFGVDPFISAIGHEGTAALMTKLTGITIPVNRVAVKMQQGDIAVVFRVLTRLPEGRVLTEDELRQIPYEFGLMRRLS